MREIKSRGYQEALGYFVHGSYFVDEKGEHWIIRDDGFKYYIWNPKTIGQYTGLKDKLGTEIYEGDILQWDEKEWGAPYKEVVKWDYDLLSMRENDWKNHCEIIGNVHQNPEIVEVGIWSELENAGLDEKELLATVKELTIIIARNLIAWNTSKDKTDGLLPEVYMSNLHWYRKVTGVDYSYRHARRLIEGGITG